MIRKYIARFYEQGRDSRARDAIRAEIIRDNTAEDEEPTYQPTDAEIDAMEREYYASRRLFRYGTEGEQREKLIENGLEAEQARVAKIKTEIPKPDEAKAT